MCMQGAWEYTKTVHKSGEVIWGKIDMDLVLNATLSGIVKESL